MDGVALAAALAVMGAIIMGLMALYSATATPRTSLERRLGGLLAESQGFEVTLAEATGLRGTRAGRVPFISNLLEGKAWTTEMAVRLEGADMRLTVSEFVGVRVFTALLGALIAIMIVGGGPVGVLIGAVFGFIGYSLPNMYVNYQRGKRIRKLNNQLPDSLSLIANSLKAGFGLMQSLDMASKELEHPIATELRRTLHDINVGAETETALQAMSTRSGSDDLDIVVTAMLVQQTTGGNLSEILENVSHTMRERIRIRGEIKTLTTQQMATGFVIAGLPIVLAVFINIINPDYIRPLYTETAGHVMIGGACVLEFFGVMVIRKILNIEV
jgi:tight adherence protein B